MGRVLSHYKNLLDERQTPEPEETDPSSPMERTLLDWIIKTQFFQKHEEQIELSAQFPVGDYLRQLDPSYQHPAYRCDFLLRYQGDEKIVNVIIEYDGFLEHFTEHKRIHVGNYDAYYRPEDIERQMVLESYGYKFLRVNRFNVGRDPVLTLSKRLTALVEAEASAEVHGVVDSIRDAASALASGSAKQCKKCQAVKPKKAFFDPHLAGGSGGFGQICADCKGAGRPPSRPWAGKARYRRWRRR